MIKKFLSKKAPLFLERGQKGERDARKYLIGQGHQILEQNYRCKIGEIDFITQKSNICYFVEVKSRSSLRFGRPEEAVDRRKQAKIKKVAMWYLKDKGMSFSQMRMSVLALLYQKEKTEVRFIEVD